MLLIVSAVKPKFTPVIIGMPVSLVAAGFEIFQLNANPWALIVVAVSPLLFFVAVRQRRTNSALIILSILMFTVGIFFIFWDQEGRLISIPFDGFIAIICASTIWILYVRYRSSLPRHLGDDPDSVVGLVGTARTSIEKFETGMVEIEGEIWTARSDEPILAGSMVRIVRSDGGMAITVEKVEKFTQK